MLANNLTASASVEFINKTFTLSFNEASTNKLAKILPLSLFSPTIILDGYRLSYKACPSLKNSGEKKILSIILIKLLYAFGVNPILKECINCKNTNLIDFNPRLGGTLCNNCSNHKSETLKYWKIYYYQKKEIDSFPDCDFDLLLNEIKLYYQFHLSIKINII